MNTDKDTFGGEAFRLDYVDTVSGQKVSTMTFYAEDQSEAVAKAYDYAGTRGWLDVKVQLSEEGTKP